MSLSISRSTYSHSQYAVFDSATEMESSLTFPFKEGATYLNLAKAEGIESWVEHKPTLPKKQWRPEEPPMLTYADIGQ